MTTTTPPQPVAQKNGIAQASLILGIVSLFFNLLLIPSILAIIFGILGIRRAKVLGRQGMSVAGIILGVVGAIVGLVLFSVILGGIGNAAKSISDDSSQHATTSESSAAAQETEAPAKADAPAGYTALSDKVYFKWGKTDSSNQFLTKKTATVITPTGCSSLYVEANEYDKDGTNIGMTNATASNLGAGDKAKLTFYVTDDGVASIKTNQVTCF